MRITATVFFTALFVLSTYAQTGVTPEMLSAANEAYQKQDWRTASARYGEIVKSEPKNPTAHYRLGLSHLNLGDAKKAQAHFGESMKISPNSVFALALARAYALGGEKEKVYEIFERSLTLGGIAAESLNGQKDFAGIRAEPRFAEYVKKLDTAANPCRNRPEFRQFDFWIGEWTVTNPQGITAGTSSIQLILGQCIIFENWNSPVSSGKSFSLFDANTGKWHQSWVTDKGGLTHYYGGMEGDKMVLIAETVANGKKTLQRMTYSRNADGAVRQHGESSNDEGKTWSTSYDFKYTRAK